MWEIRQADDDDGHPAWFIDDELGFPLFVGNGEVGKGIAEAMCARLNREKESESPPEPVTWH